MFYIKKEQNVIIIKFAFLKIKITLSIQKMLIKNFRSIISLLDYILPKNDKKIVFHVFAGQENKTEAFAQYVEKTHPDYKCIRVVDDNCIKFKDKISYNIYKFRTLYEMYTSKYIVISAPIYMLHYCKLKKHIGINIWHGMSIKNIGVNSDIHSSSVKLYCDVGKYSKTFASSDIFRIIMSSSFMAKCSNIYTTGLPITDTIFSDKNNNIIENYFNFKKYKKVVAYLPTFKSKAYSHCKQIDKEFNNIFYMDDFSNEKFINFIESQQILFIIKPHPLDEELYKRNKSKIPESPNLKIIYKNDFINKGFDLYDLYKYIDLMISDFSSTLIDYLILNRPVIYLDNLTVEYSKNRGMILPDNYSILMPGHKVKTYKELEEKIIDSLTIDSTKELRDKTIPLIHKYRDDKASERIFEIIQKGDN